jgi:hypothetical protein
MLGLWVALSIFFGIMGIFMIAFDRVLLFRYKILPARDVVPLSTGGNVDSRVLYGYAHKGLLQVRCEGNPSISKVCVTFPNGESRFYLPFNLWGFSRVGGQREQMEVS